MAELNALALHQKSAILHCAYQIIASADGGVDELRDGEVIEYLLTQLQLTGIYVWDAAIRLSPHDCFLHIASLSEPEKEGFKKLMLQISSLGGNTSLRRVCAESLFVLCHI